MEIMTASLYSENISLYFINSAFGATRWEAQEYLYCHEAEE